MTRKFADLTSARDPQAGLFLVQALVVRATVESSLANLEVVSSLLNEAAMILSAIPNNNASREHRRLTADVARLRGTLAMQQGEIPLAEPEFRTAIQAFRQLVADFPNDAGLRFDLAQVKFELASALWTGNRTTESRELLELAQQHLTTLLENVPEHYAAQNLQTRIQTALELK